MAILQNGSFYGTAGRVLRVQDVVLTETSYEPGFVVPLHAHEHPFFCVPLQGAFVEQVGRRERVLQRRSAFFHPAGEAHAELFRHGAARLFNIQVGAELISRLAEFDVQLPASHIPMGPGRVSVLGLQLYDEYRMGGERLVVDGLLLTMFGELVKWRAVRERAGVPRWLEQVRSILHDQSPRDPGLVELAATVDVHPAHLARSFRRAFGCTIGDYSRELRVRIARRLIEAGDGSLAGIAIESGFSDQSHMTRVFRRVTGMTPAAYRRAIN